MSNEKKNLPEITKSELAKCDNKLLNTKQLNLLLGATPQNHKYKRPAKGGGTWDFVTGTYVKKVLNLMFGWDWDFQVKQFEYNLQAKQCLVLGTLKVRTGGKEIIKEQFGRADIKFRKDGTLPLDLGNDLKAATTDSLKKCASELGIASDIYGKNEFKAITVIPDPEDNTAGIKQIDFAESLLRTSNYNDQEKNTIQQELEYGMISINRCQEIITNLQMNQAESLNPSMKEIDEQLDNRLGRDK
jgi:hypothetical protein